MFIILFWEDFPTLFLLLPVKYSPKNVTVQSVWGGTLTLIVFTLTSEIVTVW
jgi:hypothetical protein